ncbi:MAG TPA: Sec-independent protein translocase protein TatB [Rhodopila sp.]|nr:Sec-independent protein translocase protein TatB [Rhodopila sp.]
MFDFAWSEIALIGVVALIAIGPKDMPAAIRTIAGLVKKARRMAAEFQTHVDEMVREADLGEVKKAFSDIRNLDIEGIMEKHIDPDRSIRDTFADNPFDAATSTRTGDAAAPVPTGGEVAALDEVVVSDRAVAEPQPQPGPEPAQPLAPAFIPPGLVPPAVGLITAPADEVPAFIPPEIVRQSQSKG